MISHRELFGNLFIYLFIFLMNIDAVVNEESRPPNQFHLVLYPFPDKEAEKKKASVK